MKYIVKKRVGNVVETSEAPGPSLLIGRGANADVRFDDAAIELEHARIDPQAGGFVLTALKSVTGTWVNGERIERIVLANGDRITIGAFAFVVTYSGASEPLSLEISSVAPSARPGTGRGEVSKVDYAAAYNLGRIFLNKTALSVILSLASLLLLTGFLVAGRTSVFRPGSVSDAHMFIADQCSQCHLPLHGPSNEACQNCHVGPKHHANQVETARLNESSCVNCHVEHRGGHRLALVDNRECVTCHADLRTIDPKNKMEGAPSIFAKSVTDFVTDHPQFAISVREQDDSGRPLNEAKLIRRIRLDSDGKQVLRPPKEDDKLIGFNNKMQGMITLNHFKHLDKPVARRNDDDKVQLSCSDCHTPAADGELMQKITFANHCAGCHQHRDLKIDPKADDKKLAACTVPHGSEERVRDYLVVFFSENQCQPLPALEPDPRLLMTRLKGQPAQSVQDNVQAVEESLYRDRGCAYCHKVDREAKPWPKVVYAKIPERWFDHAKFDHKRHRLVNCEACHRGFGWRVDGPANQKKLVSVNPRESTETEDILIPGIETCRNCHRDSKRGGGQIEGSATMACGACHLYHDKNKDKDWNGKLTVDLKPVPKNHNKVAP